MTVPGATYRLQLHPGFTFRDAADQAAYLAELGVTHVYLSPSLQAAPGSTHGYDVVDPSRLDDELGGPDGFAQLRTALHERGLGIVLDIVPNHLGLLTPANPWWWDVLRHGPDSTYARHFDIDWRRRGDGPFQVLLPHLGAPLEDELVEGGALQLGHDRTGDGEDGYRLVYHEHVWPLRPGSLEQVGLDPTDVPGALSATREDPGRLFSLLLHQHYRPVHWRRGNEELNYRRFFDITTLGGVRVEDPEVFEDVHRQIFALVDEGAVDGLRIDHPDGLRDPTDYFQRLRQRLPDTWIVVEKILGADEQLPSDWPVDGTVGYEFANLVLGLFVESTSGPVISGLYEQLTGEHDDYAGVVDAAKRQVLGQLFPAEFRALLELFTEVADTAGVVAGPSELAAALLEVLVALPVYRTYVRPDAGVVRGQDRTYVQRAVAHARAHHPELDEALDLLREVLTLEQAGPVAGEFVERFQQLTGPVTAKGVEDTALYRYLRFVAVNEVGSEPAHPATSVAEFHEHARRRRRDWPAAMVTTSTHDTKRSEDVRARLAVLSELPELWVRTVEEWHELAAPHRGRHGPSPAHEYLAFQTIVGAWPLSADRLVAYLRKAAREGKRETDWLEVDTAYEADLEAYARGLLNDAAFRAGLERLLGTLVEPGRLTSLSQTLLKLTVPGVPDLYQGTELWDLSLVDPDNRRPVDFGRRHQLLHEISQEEPHPIELLARIEEGVPKLLLTHCALRLRRERPDSLGPTGAYTPLYPCGSREAHLVAFLRSDDVAVLAPRMVMGLGGAFLEWDWDETTVELPAGRWRCVITGQVLDGGGPVPVASVLVAFPVALLVRDDPQR